MFTEQQNITVIYKRLKDKVDLDLLGEPVFLDGIDYVQNKLLMFGDAINSASVDEKYQLIEKYIDCIIRSWQNGFADSVFNFTINNGIDSNNFCIILDFNEVTFEKKDVYEHINNKKWLESWSFTELDDDLQQYLKREAERRLTHETLEANWLKH